MSEAELGWIRQRAQQGLLSKARRGELILGLPIGYARAEDWRIEKHPDSRIREALKMVFRKFAELGSVRQVLLWFRQEALALPSLEERGVGRPVKWPAFRHADSAAPCCARRPFPARSRGCSCRADAISGSPKPSPFPPSGPSTLRETSLASGSAFSGHLGQNYSGANKERSDLERALRPGVRPWSRVLSRPSDVG